jgi:hypothetical protein
MTHHRLHQSGHVVHSPVLDAIPWLRHGSTTRSFNSPGTDRRDDIRRLHGLFGMPDCGVVYAKQCHTANVATVDDAMAGRARRDGLVLLQQTDAIVCPLPELTIAVFTADCVPLFLVDTRRRVAALAHAGWRGTLARIAEATVASMCETGCSPHDIVAWIGPAACGESYEVSQELADEFRAGFPDAAQAGVDFARGRLLDLPALNAHQLRRAGVPAPGVFASGVCTIRDSRQYHSYRVHREDAGRIISLMSILGEARRQP